MNAGILPDVGTPWCGPALVDILVGIAVGDVIMPTVVIVVIITITVQGLVGIVATICSSAQRWSSG